MNLLNDLLSLLYVGEYQFDCGISKMVGPKKIFGQESTYSKDFFFKSGDELWFIKKCQNCTFKVNFQCQKSTEFSHKKLRHSIENC